MLISLFVPIPVFAQVGGGGGSGGQHQYPDLYSGDVFLQSNPNADGQAYIDRSDLEDYPTIVFNSYADFLESISFEEQNWEAFFPLGVNLAFLSFDATENEIYFEKFVFEPASSQFLFESQAAAAIHTLANPNSPSFFGLFQDADKPVKPPIGHIYVIWIDSNDNGIRDPGEDTYVGSSTKVEDRFLVHDQNGMLDNPKGKIKVYPVTIDGTVTPNDEGEIDDDDDPNTGGGDGPTDDGEGDFDPGAGGGN